MLTTYPQPDNRFAIVAFRGDKSYTIPSPLNGTMIVSDSLISYSIGLSGKLQLVSSVAAGGSEPRQFALNRLGDMVAVALQADGWVIVLPRDVATGNIGAPAKEAVVGGLGSEGGQGGSTLGPVCVIWDE